MTSTVIPQPPAIPFNFTNFALRYPEFAPCGEALCQLYYDEAGIYCANSAASAPFADGTLTNLLWMLTAHIAWINAPRDANGNPAASGVPASSIVGRINSASEGSVSVGAENNFPPGTPQWYQQTRYGAAYWAATAGYRTMRYSARPTGVPGVVYPSGRGGRVF